MNKNRSQVLAAAAILAGLHVAGPAHAASSQKVTQSDWWAGVTGLPSYVNMYIYVPDQPATKPPIVVVPHHCQGTASSSHSESSGLESLANKNGFIIIYPEATGQNCWDAGSTRSLKHDGKGDTHAIAQMVRYTISKYSADATRVYSVGGSSGGIMTEALLGVYPDVFMAGVSLMGVPCGCWAEQYNDTTGSGSTAQWSGPCAGGSVSKTGKQWGDLVRSYFPEYTGHRPRLQHWHGTSDTTLNYKVMAEDIKEWTNVLGLSETPTGSDTPKSGTTHQFWKNSCYTVYETFALSGVGHSVSFDANAVATYFGLDKAGGQDPETAACPGAVPGGSGAGGAGGAGGATGTGGTTGAGGATGIDGGAGRKDGGREVGTVDSSTGPEGTGGTMAAGGTTGTGGKQGSGGREGSGGISASGGDRGSGGAAGKGGSSTEKTGGSAAGGESGAGGVASSGGSSAKGGSSTSEGSGGKRVESANGGCAIAVASPAGAPLATVALFLTTLGLALRRRRRPPRP